MGTSYTATKTVRVGVVLAGGESRRMGRDKRTLRLGGETLLQRNVLVLRGVFPVVGVSVRSADQAPADLPSGVVVVPDEAPGSPLAGLASVLARFREPVFALAADVAFADRDAVEKVLAAFADGVDVALPVAEDHLEPLHAVYGPGCLPHMQRLLAAGAHSILDLFPLVRVATVPFADAAPFFNINTPADWAEARRLLGDPFKHAPGGAAQPADDLEARNGEDVPGRRVGEPVVLGVVGRPNSGKTTLIERLIPAFTRRGLRVGAVKRVARFDIDVPGKDSWRHGQAGADAYTVASSSKLAYVARRDEEATLDEIVSRYFAGYDLVICEGYRREAPHVVEVFRIGAGYDSPVCETGEPLAVVTDADPAHEHRFGLDDNEALARFLLSTLGIAATGE